MKLPLDKLTQQQFDHIIDLLILYKQTHPKKEVYLNEKCIHEALTFMQTGGKDLADQLGMVPEESN